MQMYNIEFVKRHTNRGPIKKNKTTTVVVSIKKSQKVTQILF